MEFSALASKETSALLTRLLDRTSKASLERVATLRAALDAASKALETSIATAPEIDADVEELVKRLSKAAAAEADVRLKHLSAEARRITDALRGELAEVIGEKDALAISLKDSRAQLESVRGQLAAEQKQSQAAQKELESVRGQLATEQKQSQAAQKELAEAHSSNKKLEAAKAEAVAAREKEGAARAALESDLQGLRGQLETARKEAKRAAAEAEAAVAEKRKADVALSAANSQAQAAEAKLSAVTTLFKTSAARVQALEREQEQQAAVMRELEARTHAPVDMDVELPHAAGAGVLDGLLGAFDALSSATTIGDVLATLGEQLAAEFPRVALFRVKGNRLEGTHQIGFDLTNDIGKVIVPLAMDSLLTRAVTSGHTERLSGDAIDTSGLPFGGSPTFALAMPIVVDAESIALVYADDFAEPRQESRNDEDVNAKFAEALRQHTVALLMRLTTELKAMAELRAYAGSLLSEIEQMYVSDVAAGKQGEELQKRLHANLDYARSIFSNRAQFESPSAGALLDAQVGAMADTHKDSAFGRDLAIVIQWSSDSSRAAEAS
jgi:hypothetical protein